MFCELIAIVPEFSFVSKTDDSVPRSIFTLEAVTVRRSVASFPKAIPVKSPTSTPSVTSCADRTELLTTSSENDTVNRSIFPSPSLSLYEKVEMTGLAPSVSVCASEAAWIFPPSFTFELVV